jgi:hypothetical protein
MNARRVAMFASMTVLMTLLMNCGSTTTKPAATASPSAAPASQTAPKEPVLYTAKQCFANMANLAARWQADALPFHLESELTTEATGQDGKSTIWRALFASQTRGAMKAFICSGSRMPSAPAMGFTSTAETAYAPNVPALMFHPSYFQIDSDKTFAVTLEHGGAPMLKQDPKEPIIYLLDWDPKKKDLLWQVIYGNSPLQRKGICVVNATTGAFIRAGK